MIEGKDMIQLPTEPVKASTANPKLFVIYSPPKAGKTSLLAKLEGNLIIDLENGSDYVDALKVKANNLEELKQIGKAIWEAKKPYKYVTIDTVTALEGMCELRALELYKATPMGKNYTGTSVLDLPQGGGYLYLRLAYKEWLDKLKTLADHIILVGHLKDKFLTDKKGVDVQAKDLDLTGKIKNITCADSDAIGYLYREGDKVFINFESSDEVTCGARPAHLKGQRIHVADYNRETNDMTAYWDRIYVN